MRSISGLRLVQLPEKVRALAVAHGARQTALALVSGIERGWGKRELAAWLSGPYRRLTSFAAPQDPEDSQTFRRPATKLVAAKLEEVLVAAKEEVLATLILAAPPESNVQFTQRAIEAGHVIRTRDARGCAGWTPVDVPGMLLPDRILSLLSVDCLMRPAEYMALLSVCGQCQAVSFDPQVRLRGRCSAHPLPLVKAPLPRR